jgi:hypothetical protein
LILSRSDIRRWYRGAPGSSAQARFRPAFRGFHRIALDPLHRCALPWQPQPTTQTAAQDDPIVGVRRGTLTLLSDGTANAVPLVAVDLGQLIAQGGTQQTTDYALAPRGRGATLRVS